MVKRKRSTAVDKNPTVVSKVATDQGVSATPKLARAPSARKRSKVTTKDVSNPSNPETNPETTNPDKNSQVLDGKQALRASPDADAKDEKFALDAVPVGEETKRGPATPKPKVRPTSPSSSSELSDLSDVGRRVAPKVKAPPKKATNAPPTDPEADEGEEPEDEEEVIAALSRPPPVDSDYLPLPWKGRLGYACLNTYLRTANPPIFSSRTCRIASILEHRHPLADPTQPEHSTKNRPDKTKPPSLKLGQKYVEALGLANVRDISKMLRWNDRYGIKFMRLSSEMFPFASHEEYGYKLEPFAAEALAEAGRVVAELGHRVTTHPGQFTQLGSPRKQVIENAIRDLEYHAEMLRLLKLPQQQNRDAVMILHMGGMFGDKGETLDRFRQNYPRLNQDIKNRLVLENDDMGWSVHDLLPICEELNIPLVLDYHHHNIVFDETQIREGTRDIMDLYDRISATWKRKDITQKMHYSEPTPAAITAQKRRKHSPRVKTLPPCAPEMDLMIEAKDKEQAVFELMKIFKLPGWNTFSDITPHTRNDENKPWKPPKKKTPRKKKAEAEVEAIDEPEPQPPPIVPDDELNMGGPDGRVYWPPGMEEWLRPKKREVKKKDEKISKTTPAKKKTASGTAVKAEPEDEGPVINDVEPTPKTVMKGKTAASKARVNAATATTPASKKRKTAKAVPTPSASDSDDLSEDSEAMSDLASDSESSPVKNSMSKIASGKQAPALGRRQSGRGAKKAVVNYAEDDEV